MVTSELDVVNACLATMGQAPLTSLSRPNRLTFAAIAALKAENLRVQGVRWWFNTVEVDVVPAVGTNIVLPQLPCNILQLQGARGEAVTLRAPGVLWDLRTSEPVDYKIRVRVVYLVPFSELPPSAQTYVAASAVLKFQQNYDGDARRTEELKRERQESYIIMNAEHIRTVNINPLGRDTTAYSLHRSRGDRPFHRGR